MTRKIFSFWTLLSLLVGVLAPLTPVPAAQAKPLADSVTIVGTIQDELGCPGDWQPECTSTYLTFDADDDVWQGSWEVPAGSWEYKAALDDSWDENYGAHAQPSGDNIPLELSTATTVTFFYDDKSHWVTDDQNAVIATVAGDFQTAMGCSGDWDPGCLRSWLQDTDGDGTYSFQTDTIPAGTYECKVTIDQGWAENYGQNGVPGGDNIPFEVSQSGLPVTFSYNSTSHVLGIQVGSGPEQDGNIWADGLEHDSRDDLYRQPFGAVPTGTDITLRFRTYANDVTGVKTRIWDTAAAQQTIRTMSKVATIPGTTFDYDIWELTFAAPDDLTTLYYRFIVNDGNAITYYEDDALMDGGLGQPFSESQDHSWQINVHDPALNTPDWFKDAVVYQIFPDRFRNGVSANDPVSGTFFYEETPQVMAAPQWNWVIPDPRVSGPWEGSYSKLFYGGDLQGIIDELDYIQEMGINTLYLNPIFESPSNHKYDTTNYMMIDDNFGDMATFITLTNELESRGMHLILDGVFNHTSSDSVYFDRYDRYDDVVGACESTESPYRDWYYFRPATPAGTGVCAGDTTYEAWWGFDSLPKLNTTDVEAVRTYIYSDTNAVARYWLEQGADGWRLDVAGDVDSSFWQDWRDDIRDAKAEAITIAEEWGDASRFLLGDQLDSTMNYRFRNAIIGVLRETDWQDTNSTIAALSVSEFDNTMHGIEEDYPAEAFYAMMNLVGSHDVNRVLIPLDQDGDPTDDDYSDGKMRQKVLALVQMTMPGAPTVYYGDEVALAGYGEATPGNQGGVFYSDPYNRQPYPWADVEGYDELPEWRQADMTMRDHYSMTAAIRNAHPALRSGSFDTLLVDDQNELYAYGRRLGNDVVIVAINFGAVTQSLSIDTSEYLPSPLALTDELNGEAHTLTGGSIDIAEVPPMWGVILTVDAGQDLTAPDAPINLVASEGDGEVDLTWTSVAGAASYNVYRSQVSGGGYELLDNVSAPTYNDTDVTNGTLYYYVVTALDATGNESATSNEASALPHYTIDWANLQWPHEFTHTVSITPTEAIYGQVYIAGVTNLPGATEGLLAQVGFGSGTDTSAWTDWVDAEFNGDAGSNDEFMASLVPEVPGDYNYIYRYSTTNGRDWVYAHIDGTGTIPHFGVMHVLAPDDTIAPDAPLNLRVTHWSTDHITTQWDEVTAADLAGYDVYRYGEGETSGDAMRIARVMAPTTTYTDTDVAVDSTYTYTVRAFDMSLNKSPHSNEASGTAEARTVEVRFQVTVPPYTPAADIIYIAGDNSDAFGASWNPSAQPITQLDATTWGYTVSLKEDTALQYKFTRGSWDTVENWGTLLGEANRSLIVKYGENGIFPVEVVVYNWRDPLVVEHYPEDGATTWNTAMPVYALVSRPINPGHVTSETFAVTTEEMQVPGTLGVQSTNFDATPSSQILPILTGTLVIFTPTVPLTTSNEYTVTMVGTGYHDDVDMQSNYVWGFGAAEKELTTNVTGNGSVTLTPPGGIYMEGTEVMMTAMPDSGWMFDGWSGDVVSMDNPYTVTMDSDKVITATFTELPTYTLEMNVVGNGSITAVPSQTVFISGETVQLTAVPDTGWEFVAWSGSITSTTNPLSLVMDENKMITATFAEMDEEYTIYLPIVMRNY